MAVVKYWNYNGNVRSFVTSTEPKLVLIRPMNELHFMEELGNLVFTSGAPLNVNKQKQYFDCMPFPHTFAVNLCFEDFSMVQLVLRFVVGEFSLNSFNKLNILNQRLRI